MANISLGAEVYTWFMRETGKAYDNMLGHMIEMVEKAGFEGIEPMHFWMGDLTDPSKLADKLDQHNVKLAGIALVLDWNNPEETDEATPAQAVAQPQPVQANKDVENSSPEASDTDDDEESNRKRFVKKYD